MTYTLIASFVSLVTFVASSGAQPITPDTIQHREMLAAAQNAGALARREVEDAESRLRHHAFLRDQADQLFRKSAIAEEEHEQAVWGHSHSRIGLAIAQSHAKETDLDVRIFRALVAFDQGQPLTLADIGKLYVEQWDQRVVGARAQIEAADLDLGYHTTRRRRLERLVASAAASQNELAAAVEAEQRARHEKTRADEALKIAIEARDRALKESERTESRRSPDPRRPSAYAR